MRSRGSYIVPIIYQMLTYNNSGYTVKWVDFNYSGAVSNGNYDTPYTSIATALTNSSNNGKIGIKPGSTTLSAAIDTNGKTGIEFRGFGDVLISGADALSYLFYVRSANITLTNLDLNGINTNSTKKYSVILYSNSNLTLTDLRIRNTNTQAIWCSSNTGTININNVQFWTNNGLLCNSVNGVNISSAYVASDNTYSSGTLFRNSVGTSTFNTIVCETSSCIGLTTHTSTGDCTLIGNRGKNQLCLIQNCTGAITLWGNTNTSTLTSLVKFVDIGTTNTTTSLSIIGNTLVTTAASLGTTSELLSISKQTNVVIDKNWIESYADVNHSLIRVQSSAIISSFVIKNNVIKSRNTSGYQIFIGSEGTTANDGKLNGLILENNELWGSEYYLDIHGTHTTHNLFVGFNLGVIIRYNTVIGGSRGIAYKDGGGTATGYLLGNKCLDCGMGIIIQDIKFLKIYNATIVNNNFSGFVAGSSVIWGIRINAELSDCEGLDFKNNIVAMYNAPSNIGVACISGMASAPTGTSDYNCIYSNTGNLFTGYANWAAWQTAGYDANGLNEDPNLTNVSSMDLTLSGNSPCISTGKVLEEAYKNILHSSNIAKNDVILYDQSLISNNYCIGAYGY